MDVWKIMHYKINFKINIKYDESLKYKLLTSIIS